MIEALIIVIVVAALITFVYLAGQQTFLSAPGTTGRTPSSIGLQSVSDAPEVDDVALPPA